MCLLLSGAKIIELTGQGNEQSLKGLLYAATVVAKNKRVFFSDNNLFE